MRLLAAPRATATIFRIRPHSGIADEVQTQHLRHAIGDSRAPEAIHRAERVDVTYWFGDGRINPLGQRRCAVANALELINVAQCPFHLFIVARWRDGDREVIVVRRQCANGVVGKFNTEHAGRDWAFGPNVGRGEQTVVAGEVDNACVVQLIGNLRPRSTQLLNETTAPA